MGRSGRVRIRANRGCPEHPQQPDAQHSRRGPHAVRPRQRQRDAPLGAEHRRVHRSRAGCERPETGQYMAPTFEYILPENVVPGDAIVPNNFWNLGFLVNGEGPNTAVSHRRRVRPD